MMTSTGHPTKAEAERITRMLRLGCVACAHVGVPNGSSIEVHHICEGNRRLGHFWSLPLCTGHHRNSTLLTWLEPHQRVAISDGRKLFNAVYGTERSLWERAQTKLKLPMVWPVSKIVRRDHVALDTHRVGTHEGVGPPSETTSGTAPALQGRSVSGGNGTGRTS